MMPPGVKTSGFLSSFLWKKKKVWESPTNLYKPKISSRTDTVTEMPPVND